MNVVARDQLRLTHHRFYSWASVAAFTIVFAGFARTYYLKFLFGTPALPWLLHLHGALITLWFALFFVQSRLIAAHRVDLHRRLGVFGALLAGSAVIIGVAVALHATVRDIHDPSKRPDSIFILGVSLEVIAVFALLVGAAIALRRRGDFHKRLMLLATLRLLPAGITRIPLDFIERGGFSTAFLLTDLCIILVVAIDTFRNHRLHPAFAWGAPLIMVSMHLTNIGARTQAWTHFATWLVD